LTTLLDMQAWMKDNVLQDPRHFQIVTLSSLLMLQLFWADFGPTFLIVAVTLLSVLITQFVCSRFLNLPFDGRSPLITGLSLAILLKSGAIWIYPLAALVAVTSKFFVRIKNSHIFNPANIGIVIVLIAFPNLVWVSPGQWGAAVWLAVLLLCFAALVLFKIPRRDMAFLFMGLWSGALLLRAFWLGDPIELVFNQLQNGALLIFAFFMISDPKTIPARFWGRFIFALVVVAIAYILTFEFRLREALFYALALTCFIRPLIDMVWRGQKFNWHAQEN